MKRAVRQALRLSPLLLWRSLFQPTKLYRSIYSCKRTQHIYTWAFFFWGLLMGGLLGVLFFYFREPFYGFLFSGTVGVSMATAFAVAAAFGFAFAFAVAVANAGSLTGPVDSPGAGIFIFAVAFAGAGAAAAPVAGFFVLAGISSILAVLAGAAAAIIAAGASVTGAFSGAALVEGTFMPSVLLLALTALGAFLLTPAATLILLGISIICWFIIFLYGKDKIKIKDEAGTFIFLSAWFLMIFSGGGAIHVLRANEMILYPLAFLVGYLFSSIFDFVDKSREFKKHFNATGVYDWDVGITYQKFMKTQKLCMLWGPLLALILFVPVYFNILPKLDVKLIIAATGFAALPIFILHIPTYLISLPLWIRQQRKILTLNDMPKKMIKSYKRSILFKLEMCYFQLPGLHKIITAFSRNKSFAMAGAVKLLHDLFWFTFQARQAEKALLALVEDKENGHELMLALIENKSLPLLALAATKSGLAKSYLMLFEKKKRKWLADVLGSLSFDRKQLKKMKTILGMETSNDIASCIDSAAVGMEVMGPIPNNDLVVRSLRLCTDIIRFETLGEFINASLFNSDSANRDTPGGIFYFTFLQGAVRILEEMQHALSKLEDAAIFKNQRKILEDQKKRLRNLREANEKKLMEPFLSIWQTANRHLDELMTENLRELGESAFLSVDVINPELTVARQEQDLKIEIRNSSHELATEIFLELENQSPLFNIAGERKRRLSLLEPVSRKQVEFPVVAVKTGKTTMEGLLQFSDRVRQAKRLHFSIPISVRPQPGVFRTIFNPYTVGQPLGPAHPLFFGREEEIKALDNFARESMDSGLIVCHGLRRSGKSSLLLRVHDIGFSDKRYVPVYVDLQGVDDELDFYDTLATAISEVLELESESRVENFNRFKRFFRKIKSQLNDRRVILMLDEYEELEQRVEEKRIPVSIFSHIRYLMEHQENLVFLFSGSAKPERLNPEYWAPFCDPAVYIHVGFLAQEAAVRLITEPAAPVLFYDQAAVEEILTLTSAQPYQVQLLCRTLVDILNERKDGNRITTAHVEEASGRISTIGEDIYSRNIWQNAGEAGQLVLCAAARASSEERGEPVMPEEIIARVELITEKFDSKTLLAVIQALTEQDILGRSGSRYYFPSQLTANWISGHYPLGNM